jgi:acetyl CoA:N6-hydroxylysine acetyl transferase
MNKYEKEHLLCKPSDPQFSYHHLPSGIRWTSLSVDEHLPVIHDWFNRDYTKAFWQMDGSIGLLRSCYQAIQTNPYAHAFIGYVDNDPVALFDVYCVHADELAGHITRRPHDCGFHLCMAPNEKPLPHLSTRVVLSFLKYYFSFEEARRMYAEPDINNHRSILLLKKCGFRPLKKVQLSYKEAQIHYLDRGHFNLIA